jgi:hypothetical protein
VVILEVRGSHKLFTQAGMETPILWISASQIGRIIDVSHLHLATS